MNITVIKRSGIKTDFDKEKIILAITKAYDGEEVPNYAYAIAKKIEKYARKNSNIIYVEDIQNLIELYLMKKDKRTAREFIRYRYKREVARNSSTEFIDAMTDKLMAKNVENSNANVDEHSFGGRVGEASNEMMKQYALDHCMSELSRKNHLNNEIYIHDLSAYAVGMHNCLSMPLDDLLAKGFNTRQVDIRPAGSINTAFQLVAVLFQLQSLMQFGGVSATHLDWTMVPYIRRSFYKHYKDGIKYFENESIDANDYQIKVEYTSIDDAFYRKEANPKVYEYAMDMTKRELNQAVEGFYHNLNSLQSRSGNQLPFSSINYGTCTLIEGRMVLEAILGGSLKGVGKFHRTSVFPCGIFQCMKGVNQEPNEPNYDLFQLALQSTAKRLYPNYVNVDWSGNAGYDRNDPKTYMSTMGCRTSNGFDINGLGQQKDGRGNICPVTIILPTLAMQARELWEEDGGNEDSLEDIFLNILYYKIGEAKDMLIERFEYICSQPASSAKFMYENNTMAGYVPEEGIRSALKHGTLALGQLGLAETLQILVGCDHTEKTGMDLAKKIEQMFKERCAEFKEKYKLNFGVYYTPAESLCYTAMKKFQQKYGIIPNVSDREYFTNSIHVPVWKELSPFEKIDIESQLTGYSSAGCITYVEMPSGVKNNIDALEQIVKYAMNKDIPYFAINVPVDTCLNCGYSDEINDKCPECGSSNIQRLRRVTGYLTNDYKTAFNYGKQKETEDRVKHAH